MDGLHITCILCVLLYTASFTQAHSETVTCNSDHDMDETYCQVDVHSLDAVVTMLTAEDNDIHCEKDFDYGYANFNDQESYVWVTFGCGGTFKVTSGSSSSTSSPSSSGTWGEWSACSATCGNGYQYRMRASDFDQEIDNRECNLQSCTPNPTTASWGAWGNWGACSKQCGGGIQERIRLCSTGFNTDCSSNAYANMQSKNCNTQACTSGNNGKGTTTTTTQGFCGKEPASNTVFRILGGTEAKNCQYPWMVMVINTKEGTQCGGSIIDSKHILTAGHCVVVENDSGVESPANAADLEIWTGSSKMPVENDVGSDHVVRKVSKIKVHEKFNYDDNDIAIVTLAQPMGLDNCHVPICLPVSKASAVGVSGCRVMGWGVTGNGEQAQASSDLLSTEIKVRQPSYCSQTMGDGGFNPVIKLCAGGNGAGSCGGDSGGPLVCPGADNRFYQYGIVSSGEKDCGSTPGLYTKVSNYIPWIKANTQ